MIICGIDASSSCTGVCIFQDGDLIYYNKVRPYSNLDFRHNTCEIIEQIVDIVNQYCPDVIYMEDVPLFADKKRGLRPLISLGAVQGIFYHELVYKYGYNIEYVPLTEWRKEFGFLKGERKRDKQKAKAVEFANHRFGLKLQYTEGKSLVSNDDDIAEAILIAYSQIIKE